jgi:beta-glucuronidase
LCAVAARAQSTPIVLADVDHRKSLSLDGEWHIILDPYDRGLYNFHREIRKDGYFLNAAPQPGDNSLVEYDFSKSPTIKVPGDWNTQRDTLFNYEGLMWYQRYFEYQQPPGHKTFLHIGAANYRSIFWVNGERACEHEGGFTSFDCEVTNLVHAGRNFVVAAVDDTRQADGVPTLNTDWFNYGGLTRDVSLIDVPAKFIDAYDLHLNSTRTMIEGRVHVQDGLPGENVSVSIPELNLTTTAILDAASQASIALVPKSLTLWSPKQPKLYQVFLTAGLDTLEDDIVFCV